MSPGAILPPELTLGALTLTTVLDGAAVICPLVEAYAGPMDEGDWRPYRALYPELFAGADWRLPVACPLLRTDDRVVLVDVGAGPAELWLQWFPGLRPEIPGSLPESLAAVGVRTADVDTVFITHFDADHIGWLADGTFRHARLLASEEATADARERTTRDWLRRVLDRVEAVRPGDEVLPGVAVVAYPGHVPGHVGLEVDSRGRRALLIADSVPHAALLDRLDWRFVFDHDVEGAAATREQLVASVVDTDTFVVSGHFPGSGIGRVVRRDDRVVWEAVA